MTGTKSCALAAGLIAQTIHVRGRLHDGMVPLAFWLVKKRTSTHQVREFPANLGTERVAFPLRPFYVTLGVSPIQIRRLLSLPAYVRASNNLEE